MNLNMFAIRLAIEKYEAISSTRKIPREPH